MQTNGQEEQLMRVSFSEGAIVGTRKLLDFDSQKYEARSASIDVVDNEDQEIYFKLSPTLNAEGRIRFLHLETTRALDRERKASHRLSLRLDRKTAFRLFVSVLDINDNPPVFPESVVHVSVNRTQDAGKSVRVAKVRAEDADEGKNARLSYHMAERFRTHFKLDPDNGELRTKADRDLICEEGEDDCPVCLKPDSELCSILIYAKDAGKPQQSAYTLVKVKLEDDRDSRGDSPPEITIRYLPDPSKGYSLVAFPAEKAVSVAAVTLASESPNARLKIVSGDRKGNFRYAIN